MLRELVAETSRNGWIALGIDRDDPPTQTALIEEAIRLLAQQQKTTSRRTKR
ncbi:MAG: hypothetical protein H6708_22285 [Kofleriaceae bacterium]|nr:hypothetical protein [Kofleriaceae bacterium]